MSSNILGRRVVKIALKDVGAVSGSARHRAIINDFNKVKPHGYTASIKDYWCDEAYSTWMMRAGLTSEDVPLSCNVDQSIADAKKLGIWHSSSHKPRPGDGIVLDWDLNGRPNHIGLVVSVTDRYVHTVEGNAGDAGVCKRKSYARHAAIIYGYICPRYNAILINKRAIDYSYPLGTDEKKYSVKTGKPRAAYKKAWHKYFPKRKLGNGCHQFVMLVMRACGYKVMPLGWTDIRKYLKERCDLVKFNHKASELRKGDIMIYRRVDKKGSHYHIWVIAEVDGKLCVVEARQSKCWPYKRSIKKALKKYSNTWVYRPKEIK